MQDDLPYDPCSNYELENGQWKREQWGYRYANQNKEPDMIVMEGLAIPV